MSEISRAIAAKQALVKTLQNDLETLRRAASLIGQKKPTTATPTRRRGKMSAAARKTLSKKLKAYWAKKKKAKK